MSSLKTTLVSVGVAMVAGFGFMALAGGEEAEPPATGSAESVDLDRSLEDSAESHPSAKSLAEASPSVTSRATLPLPDFDSSSEVRDGFLVLHTYSGLHIQVAGEADYVDYASPGVGGVLEVTDQIEAVTGSGAEPLLAVLVETRKPASGLEPESYEAVLRTFERESTGASAETEVPGIEHSSFGSLAMYGSDEGSIILADPDYSNPTVRFFAADTLEETGSVASRYIGQRDGNVYVSPADNTCELSAWSAADGKQLWVNEYGLSVEYASCNVEVGAQGIVVEVNGSTDYLSVLDPLTGEPVGPQFFEATEVRFDPAAPRVAVEYSTSEPSETALRVYDAESWQPLLDVSTEQFQALRMREYYLYGGKLYATNTDEQPVLDSATGEKLADRWSLRPIAPVGTDWTLVRNESDNSYSLHANKDGLFAGPWW